MALRGLLLRAVLLFSLALPGAARGYDPSCRILALNMDTGWDDEALALLGVAPTYVTPADFLGTDLGAFDVLYVGSAFKDGGVTIPSQDALDALNARAGDIAAFVQRGGGVLALSEPIGAGNWAWTPVFVGGTGGFHANDVLLVDPAHPVAANLSSDLLANWGSSYHDVFSGFDGSLGVLATNWSGDALTLVGEPGYGRVVFTGQDADFHLFFSGGGIPGTRLLITNALDWLCEPRVLRVQIDIRPGSATNGINLGAPGVLPVAILGSPSFDAATVDPSTVTLAGAPVQLNGRGAPMASLQDVNGDGLVDLLVHVAIQALALGPSDTAAVLEGRTFQGMAIVGSDAITIVP